MVKRTFNKQLGDDGVVRIDVMYVCGACGKENPHARMADFDLCRGCAEKCPGPSIANPYPKA